MHLRKIRKLIAALPIAAAVIYMLFGDPLGDLLRLNLTGNDSSLARQVKSRLVQQSGSSQYRLDYSRRAGENAKRTSYDMLKIFRTTMGDNWMSTVRVVNRGKQVAMGTIVDQRGWILTKSSEVDDDYLRVRFHDQKVLPATVVARRPDVDLALLMVERTDLKPAKFATSDDALRVGSWVATADLRRLPSTIGVVGVLERSIRRENPVMGVGFRWTGDGILVDNVVEGSGAYRAGIESGDVIEAINSQPVESRFEFTRSIGNMSAGDTIKVSIVRNEKRRDLKVRLMDLNRTLLDPTEMEVTGRISARATGFASAFQHDTVLRPNQCGGPLVNLKGEVVGINISRAGRVNTYALPNNVVRAALADMMATANGSTLVNRQNSDPASLTNSAEVIRSAKPAYPR